MPGVPMAELLEGSVRRESFGTSRGSFLCPLCKDTKVNETTALCPSCSFSCTFEAGGLGISLAALDTEQQKRTWPSGYTVYIASVDADSVAEQSGVKRGMALCAVNDQTLRHVPLGEAMPMLQGAQGTRKLAFTPLIEVSAEAGLSVEQAVRKLTRMHGAMQRRGSADVAISNFRERQEVKMAIPSADDAIREAPPSHRGTNRDKGQLQAKWKAKLEAGEVTEEEAGAEWMRFLRQSTTSKMGSADTELAVSVAL